MELIVGQRIDLESIFISNYLRLKVNLSFSNKLEDVLLSCIALNENEKLIDERYIIYSENTSSPEGAIKYNTNKKEFDIDFNLLPKKVKKISLLLSIDEDGNLTNISNCTLRIFNQEKEVQSFKFSGENYINQEKVLILLEIYNRNNKWRLGIIVKGFNLDINEFLEEHIDENSSDIMKEKEFSEGKIEEEINKNILTSEEEFIEENLCEEIKDENKEYINKFTENNEQTFCSEQVTDEDEKNEFYCESVKDSEENNQDKFYNEEITDEEIIDKEVIETENKEETLEVKENKKENTNMENVNDKNEIEKSSSQIRKLKITSECVACGACTILSEYISENTDGTIYAKNDVIIKEKDLKNIEEVIQSCPVKAIQVENSGISNKSGKEGLLELKNILESEFNNYKFEKPSYDSYKFDKNLYSVPTAYGSNERRYSYKSDSKAISEGLREFDRIMYSQRRALVQQLLVQYKNNTLRKFTEYIKEPGNYYYDILSKVNNRIKEFIEEAKVLSNNKINFPEGFEEKEIEPVFGIKGDKFNREVFVYPLKHLEEMWIVDNIVNELDPLYEHEIYINTDDMEIYNGRKEVDMYCYDLREVTNYLAKWILYETESAVNSYDGMREFIEQISTQILVPMEKQLSEKVKILSDSIDKVIS